MYVLFGWWFLDPGFGLKWHPNLFFFFNFIKVILFPFFCMEFVENQMQELSKYEIKNIQLMCHFQDLYMGAGSGLEYSD